MKNIIYKFVNKQDEVIYVGITKNLENRMNIHRNNGHLPPDCYSEMKAVYYDECLSYGDLRVKEYYLINILSPKYNSVGKYNYKFSFKIPEPNWRKYNPNKSREFTTTTKPKEGIPKNNIRKIISEKQTTIQSIIQEVGVAKSYFYDVMNSQSVPSLTVARKISEVLDEDLDYVFPERRF